jgi:hypothetical protein|tara:strand:+ start:321 stop:845 length:525 start_codon:yes stop_codon:yes gene_type:complete
MASIKDVIANIEQIYGSNNSLNLLKDFERVVDELDLYVFENWMDGELAAGPKEDRYFIECTFMWPKDRMPEPAGGKRLLEYGCKVAYAESAISKVRRIKTPDDIRPGTRKGKIDIEEVWMVKIKMPKALMKNVDRGYTNLDKNKVQDILSNSTAVQNPEPVEQTAQGTPDEEAQ